MDMKPGVEQKKQKAPSLQPQSPAASGLAPAAFDLSPDRIQRTRTSPQHLLPADVAMLQRTIGNHATAELLGRQSAPGAHATPLVQAKLTVGPAHDPYEDEADQIAGQVMRTPTPPIVNRKEEEEEAGLQRLPVITPIQRAAPVGLGGGAVDADLEGQLRRSQTGGSSLPGSIRRTLEPKLGADLSSVKVHTGSQAAQLSRDLGAKAFTHGSHIFYGQGQSPGDLKLTAHEAVHTIQQGAVQQTTQRVAEDEDEAAVKRMPVGKISRIAKTPMRVHRTPSDEPVIQRLSTRKDLIAVAGEPHEDVKVLFFKKKMSGAYKTVLSALDSYHNFLRGLPTTETGGMGFNPLAPVRINQRLDTLRDTLQQYARDHADDQQRTPHIQKILDEEIPRERAAVEAIQQNPQPYLRKTFEEAIDLYLTYQSGVTTLMDINTERLKSRDTQELKDRLEAKKKGEKRQDKTKLATLTTGPQQREQALTEFGEAMTDKSTAFTFRGEDRGSVLSAAGGVEAMRPFFESKLMPTLAALLRTPNEDIEVDPLLVTGSTQEEKTNKRAENLERLRGFYNGFMGNFTADQADAVPLTYAQYCTRMYDLALARMGADEAYLFTSSQIFLRVIVPFIGALVGNIDKGIDKRGRGKGARGLTLLQKLVQNDANNVKHDLKTAFFKELADTSYTGQIREYVMAVVARGRVH